MRMYSDGHSSVFISSASCKLDLWECMCRLNGDHSERTVLILNSCHYYHELILLFFRIYSLYRLNFTLSDKEWWPSEKDDYLIMFAKCCDGGLRETDLRRVMSGSTLRRSNCVLAEYLENLRVWFLRKTLRLLYHVFLYKWPITMIVKKVPATHALKIYMYWMTWKSWKS
jgi:hypothetical protein